MRNILAYLLVFYALIILGAPQALTHCWIHGIALLFSLVFLFKLSRYYSFWLFLLVCFFFASEPRFSVEYFFISMGFAAWGFSGWWLGLEKRKRIVFLAAAFSVLLILNTVKIGLFERGSLVMWLPIFIALYFSPQKNKILYGVVGVFTLFSNKTSTLISYLSILLSRYKSLIGSLAALFAFSLALTNAKAAEWFLDNSVLARAMIWTSSIRGFFAEPIFGHGFRTFALDYTEFRAVSNTWATLRSQQVAHGHSLLFHSIFELGVLGLIFYILFMYLVYKRAPKAFVPLFVLSLIDLPLSFFSQFLLASLILAPFLFHKKTTESVALDIVTAKIPKKISWLFIILAYVLALYSYVPSLVGHYYYDKGRYDEAIAWDKDNSLYYLTRGIILMRSDHVKSLDDLRQAVKLSPGVGYFYGFLAAAELANKNFRLARVAINKTLEFAGASNPYWRFIQAMANFKNKGIFYKSLRHARHLRPTILDEVRSPRTHAGMYIGSNKSDVRVLPFLRRGPRLFLPLPYIKNCPDDPELLRQRLIEAANIKK